MDRLARKFETARQFVPAPVIDNNPAAKVGLVAFGTSDFATEESRDQLREESGLETSYFRLRAYPFTEALAAFIDAHERVYIIEQNRDAQLRQLMTLELTPARIAKLRSILHYNGLPIDARSITDALLSQEGFEVATKASGRISAGTAGGE
jgi:2-oxoglutarate ferredoxin oxidoreductase subunit alpha